MPKTRTVVVWIVLAVAGTRPTRLRTNTDKRSGGMRIVPPTSGMYRSVC